MTGYLSLGRTCLVVALAFLAIAGTARASLLTDGSLSLDISSDGQFRVITLNGTDIDPSATVQKYYLMGGVTFTGGTTVSVTGSTATYTTTAGLFNVSVTSTILGPLDGYTGTTGVLEQTLVFTNPGTSAVTLAASSYMDQDLKATGAGDTVAWDADQEAVYAVDAPQLMAAIAKTDVVDAVLGWDVDTYSLCDKYFPMSDGTGPVGPADTGMAIGYNVGQVAPGGTATYTFHYLFSTNLASVPETFTFVPEPGTLVMLAAGGGGGALMRRRRGV